MPSPSPSDRLSCKYRQQKLPNFPLGFPAFKGEAGGALSTGPRVRIQALGLINSSSTRPAPGNALILPQRGRRVGRN